MNLSSFFGYREHNPNIGRLSKRRNLLIRAWDISWNPGKNWMVMTWEALMAAFGDLKSIIFWLLSPEFHHLCDSNPIPSLQLVKFLRENLIALKLGVLTW